MLPIELQLIDIQNLTSARDGEGMPGPCNLGTIFNLKNTMYTEVEDANGNKIKVRVLESSGGIPTVVEYNHSILTRKSGDGRFF